MGQKERNEGIEQSKESEAGKPSEVAERITECFQVSALSEQKAELPERLELLRPAE